MGKKLKKKRILIIDDEQIILDVLGEILCANSLNPEKACSHEEAVNKFCKAENCSRPYNLVLLDLFMYGKPDGLKTFDALKRINKECKAIIMTGSSNHPAIENFKKYGFVDRIYKPFNLDEIISKIKNSI